MLVNLSGPAPIPPVVLRVVKMKGKGIKRFYMIRDGETVLLGISGGKDSLALALALSLRKRWLPITYNLTGLLIEWEEFPLPEEKKQALLTYFSELDIPLSIKRVKMFNDSFKGEFNCYLCSRNRKRILFEEAGMLGITKIALGHNMDDILETTLINMCFRGNISTMLPVQHFFNGKLTIIRPLCEVKESVIKRVAEQLELPVCENGCHQKDNNIRNRIKPIVQQLVHLDKRAREHIYNAPFNIIKEYLPIETLNRTGDS